MMQLANESAEVALRSDSTMDEIDEKIRELIALAVATKGDRREVTYKLACALSDFADLWKADAEEASDES